MRSVHLQLPVLSGRLFFAAGKHPEQNVLILVQETPSKQPHTVLSLLGPDFTNEAFAEDPASILNLNLRPISAGLTALKLCCVRFYFLVSFSTGITEVSMSLDTYMKPPVL